ncbi:MAG: 50S ribosomal protein L28 [PVC group bacterium]|nr:50S ribosomal protein L28 [PVC group bacterium]
MGNTCAICGKGPTAGRSFTRRGLAKKKGGVGKKVTGITKRRFLPNLQSVKSVTNGTHKTVKACTECIRSGKVSKA